MVTRKKTARRRRATRRTGTRRSVRTRTRRSVTGARPPRQQADFGPNLTRLLRADVLTARCARSLSRMILDRIEELSDRDVNTLISVRRRVGRKLNCWLI
jgi:hypothetical protein